jgi:hypothetical protein
LRGDRESGSERDHGSQQASCLFTPGECSAELDGIQGDLLGSRGLRITHVCRAHRTGEFEDEWPAVTTCPFRHDVCHDATVMVSTELQRLVECTGRIDAVHPEVS